MVAVVAVQRSEGDHASCVYLSMKKSGGERKTCEGVQPGPGGLKRFGRRETKQAAGMDLLGLAPGKGEEGQKRSMPEQQED